MWVETHWFQAEIKLVNKVDENEDELIELELLELEEPNEQPIEIPVD